MKAQVVSFHCVLTDKVGKIISSTFNQDVMTYTLEEGACLQGLSEGLQNLKIGEKRRITLSASQAYGFYDLSLVIELSRKRFPNGSKLRVGDQVSVLCKNNKAKSFRVIQAGKKLLTLDGNHPLAGQDLTFDIEGVQTRDATSEELAETNPRRKSQYCH